MPTAEQKPRALVTPEVLVWARQEAGLDPEAAARKLGVKAERLVQWEAGQERPTIPQLLSLSRMYKRNPAVFYLPGPPAEALAVRDFRRLSDLQPAPLSPQLRYEIRLAHTRRQVLLEVLGANAPETRLSGVPTLEADPEEAGTRIRQHLGVTLQEQKTWRNADRAFKNWREALERTGILVFQTNRVDVQEMRGFSIAEARLPVILLNGGDAPPGKCFSALHELCHLILRTGGLCLPGQDRTGVHEDDEVLCNRVAGAALVPAESLLAEEAVRTIRRREDWTDEDLLALARSYSVSREVILRRLLILGRTTERFYREKRQQFIAERQSQEQQGHGGYAPPHAVTLNRVGRLYARSVLEGFHDGRVSASDLSRYLGLKLQHLPDFEASVYST